MDLEAYLNILTLDGYVSKHYGKTPRPRGIRLMKLEKMIEPEENYQESMFNKHCGEDVIYIHTRCGAYGHEKDPDCNYISCGGKNWEESNPDTFIESTDDAWDPAYRDHYFKAVVDDEYKKILEEYDG